MNTLKTIIFMLMVYLRHAFQRGGGIWFPLLLSATTSFMLLFAVHTALPDTTKGLTEENYRIVYQFPQEMSLQDCCILLNEDLGAYLEGFCTVSLTEEPGVCLLGVWDHEINNELSEVYTLTNSLIPPQFFAQLTNAKLSIDSHEWISGGITEDSPFIPIHLPPKFLSSMKNRQLVKVLLGDTPLTIHDADLRSVIDHDLTKIIQPEQLELTHLRYFGNTAGDNFAAVSVPFPSLIENNPPVHALYLTTSVPASQVENIFLSHFPSDTLTLPDYDDIARRANILSNNNMIRNSLNGIIPFYTLLLLSQVAIWGLYLEKFKYILYTLHLLGCSIIKQVVLLTTVILILEIASFGIGFSIFSIFYPLFAKEHVLWGFDWKAVALALSAFMLSHGLYTIWFFIVKQAQWRKEGIL